MPMNEMLHEVDPADAIFKKIGMRKGVLPGFTIFGNRVLVGIYERPEKLKSGLVITDKTRQEDEHQGKAAIVLMKGPTAFVSDDHFDFQGQTVDVGEWISLWVTDGRKIKINGQLCRVIRDQDINFRIPAPDAVY